MNLLFIFSFVFRFLTGGWVAAGDFNFIWPSVITTSETGGETPSSQPIINHSNLSKSYQALPTPSCHRTPI